MGKFRDAVYRADRFRVTLAVTIGALVLLSRLLLKYPLVFLAFLILGLVYAVYRIINDRKGGTVSIAMAYPE